MNKVTAHVSDELRHAVAKMAEFYGPVIVCASVAEYMRKAAKDVDGEYDDGYIEAYECIADAMDEALDKVPVV